MADNLLVCFTCGTQFDTLASEPLPGCNICDDPRQFVPPTGQAWTSLARLHKEDYSNTITALDKEEKIWQIRTEPKLGIGQRAFLLETEAGNILWDCITLLDRKTIDFIRSKGGLKAIVISHPHYYSTHLVWAETFDCPVHLAADDAEWLNREDQQGHRRFITAEVETIIQGVQAIKIGGHFPGSLLLHWKDNLFIADTFVIVPSGLYHVNRPPGTATFTFMWSIPNMLPLSPDELLRMWRILKPFDFNTTYGAFAGLNITHADVKARVLDSMQIQTRHAGWSDVGILTETL